MVLCIDATASMKPVINMVKRNALNLADDIINEAKRNHKEITNLRIKIILFRDYMSDGEYAMQETDFLELPAEKEDFNGLITSIIADGGGDEPEDGLEALAYAMKSSWQPEEPGTYRRQIIVVWTDASTHDIGFGSSSPYYDKNLPKNFDELTEWWGDEDESDECLMHYESKRLVLFAPNAQSWVRIQKNWDNVIFVPSIAGEGLKEQDYESIIRLIVQTA